MPVKPPASEKAHPPATWLQRAKRPRPSEPMTPMVFKRTKNNLPTMTSFSPPMPIPNIQQELNDAHEDAQLEAEIAQLDTDIAKLDADIAKLDEEKAAIDRENEDIREATAFLEWLMAF